MTSAVLGPVGSGRLSGRVAIVTAAGGAGIGQAVARGFAEQGAQVIVSDRSAERADEAAAAIRDKGGEAVAVACDVTNPEDVQALVGRTIEAFGPPQILFNNAGASSVKPVVELGREDWDLALGVNLLGTFHTCQKVLPHMLAGGYGRIVNVSSYVALAGEANQAHYAAAKAGVIGFTKSLAREVARAGITANVIAPGFIANEFVRRGFPEEMLERLEAQTPVGRAGDPLDIVGPAIFLASTESAYLTGQTVTVAGGLAMP